jgi:hypothetical protein
MRVHPFLPRGSLQLCYVGDGATLYLLPSGRYVTSSATLVTEVSQKWAAQRHLVILMAEMTLTPHAMAAMLGVPTDVAVRWLGGEETLTEDVIRKIQRKTSERSQQHSS